MKDESFLDSVGPVFIVASLALFMVLMTWVMVRGNGDWGSTEPPAVSAAVEDVGH